MCVIIDPGCGTLGVVFSELRVSFEILLWYINVSLFTNKKIPEGRFHAPLALNANASLKNSIGMGFCDAQ